MDRSREGWMEALNPENVGMLAIEIFFPPTYVQQVPSFFTLIHTASLRRLTSLPFVANQGNYVFVNVMELALEVCANTFMFSLML